MTTTRALAVAAYLSAVAAPAAADWRSIADALHAALPAVRGAAVKPAADAPAGAVPRWFADWKLGKVYSLDSLAVTFADGATVRVNLAKAPGKAPRIAAACRVAIAFYRASTGRDSVPAFASLVAASDGESFDAAACSALTDGLRRTAYVEPAVRPAVTAEAVARMEREMERRRAGLVPALADLEAMRERPVSAWCNAETKESDVARAEARAAMWQAAVDGGERELAAMLDALAADSLDADPEAEAEPVEAVNEDPPVPPTDGAPAASGAVEAATVDHVEPFALCPALGLPCKPDCGFRSGCTPRVAVANAGPSDPLNDAPAPHLSGDDAPARSPRRPRAPRRLRNAAVPSRGTIAPASMAIALRPAMRAALAPLHSAPTL